MIFARYDIFPSESVHCNIKVKIKMSKVLLAVMDKQCMKLSLLLIYCSFPNLNYIPDLKHFEIISEQYELWRSNAEKYSSTDMILRVLTHCHLYRGITTGRNNHTH